MINNYFELDGDGIWLPEGWNKMDLYTKKNGRFAPRNGIYGCRWVGSLGKIKIVKKAPVSFTISGDRMVVAMLEKEGGSDQLLRIYLEDGEEFGCIKVPKFNGDMRELPTFYSISMPAIGMDFEVKYNDGDDDYMARLTPELKIVDVKKIRW
ncbi:hypothetical protein [Marinospirillum sp.]|uniref:hypothetical protein n=1 Tax=Marinospirillum sp. TaxID=2183934 RepID=UPI00286FE1CD|nr:hypothetical protein [Marinospirillum sp.]MDR9469293.1 hypothetical protein [Marinospirillum sp.]